MKDFIRPIYSFLLILFIYFLSCYAGYNLWEEEYENYVHSQMNILFTAETIVEYGLEEIDPMSFIDTFSGGELRVKSAPFKPDKVGKIYLSYEINLRQYSEEFIRPIAIVDTQAPNIELAKSKVTIEFGSTYDPSKNISKAFDVVDGDLKFSKKCEFQCYGISHSLNTKKAGTYKVKAFAIDRNGLKTEKTFDVIVKAKPKGFVPILGTNLKKYQHTLNLNNVKMGNNLYNSLVTAVNGINSGKNKCRISYSNVGRYDGFSFWWRDIEQLTGYSIDAAYACLNGNCSKVEITFDNYDAKRILSGYNKVLGESAKYKEMIRKAWSGISLYNDDASLVNHLDKWMRKNFSYKVTGGTVYSFVSSRKGQCYHYAHFFKSALDAIGIPVKYVEGYGQGGYHSWNKVKIDGYWYIVDTTWSDLRGSSRYILKTPKQLKGYVEGWTP